MRASGTKYKTVIFALLLLGISFFIFSKHRLIEERDSFSWLRAPLVWMTSPVSRGVFFVRDKISLIFHRYFFLVNVEKENAALRRENEDYELRLMLDRQLGRENERLSALMELKGQLSGEWIAARVVSYPPIGPYRMLTIDQGRKDGIARRSPVISSKGLVGLVTRVEEHRSHVLLMTDPTSAVDVRIDQTDSRGLVVGKISQLGLQRDLFIGAFEYLNEATTIEEGAAVVTSGMDGVYPAGILVGYVIGNKKKKYDIFQQGEVMPAVDFFKLREVLVLKKP